MRQRVGDQIQKSFMKRPRNANASICTRSFLVYKLEKFNWPPERPDNGKYKGQWLPLQQENDPNQCSYESNSDISQFNEHKKSGIGAASADPKPSNSVDYKLKCLTCELRWRGNPSSERRDAENLRQLSAYKNQEKGGRRELKLHGQTRIFPLPKKKNMLESRCGRNVFNWCRIRISCSIGYRTHRWPSLQHENVTFASAVSLIQHEVLCHLRWLGETQCKEKK